MRLIERKMHILARRAGSWAYHDPWTLLTIDANQPWGQQ
jgi:hypothetical protein